MLWVSISLIPTMTTSHSNLSTSRIARLFRPLRAKCKHLSAVLSDPLSKSRHSAPITYTSRHKHLAPPHPLSPPPEVSLTIIPPPHRLGSIVHLDESSRDKIKLSKALYDVRDAYHNILQVCFGKPNSQADLERPMSRLSSLSTLCAIVVGRSIESEAQAVRQVSHETAKSATEGEDVELIAEIYEDIPSHHRTYVVLLSTNLVVLTILHAPVMLSSPMPSPSFLIPPPTIRRSCQSFLRVRFNLVFSKSPGLFYAHSWSLLSNLRFPHHHPLLPFHCPLKYSMRSTRSSLYPSSTNSPPHNPHARRNQP